MDVVKIGGVDRKILLREFVCNKLLVKYNEIISSQNYQNESNRKLAEIKNKYEQLRTSLREYLDRGICTDAEYADRYKKLGQEEIIESMVIPKTVPDSFLYYCAWRLLVKSGIWPFRKPFRSYRHMYKNMLRGEAVAIVQFILSQVFGYKVTIDDPDSKKKTN